MISKVGAALGGVGLLMIIAITFVGPSHLDAAAAPRDRTAVVMLTPASSRLVHLVRAIRQEIRHQIATLPLVRVRATSYCDHGPTYSGHLAGYGSIAVDPHTIPLGTRLYIPGWGYGTADDIGGGIRGKRVDLWLPSCRASFQWGVRPVMVFVTRPMPHAVQFLASDYPGMIR